METRANHLLIGGFVLAIIAATFGFVVWLAKVDIEREYAYYNVYFEESVAGLSVGGDVRFNGIPVGTVAEIRIAPDDPSRVQVMIEVGVDTPVRADTMATLAFKGITGVSFVQLSGGDPKKPLLKPAKEGELPVIASTPSALHELFAGAPELIDRVIILVDRLAEVVDKENQANFAKILENVDGVTSQLNSSMPKFDKILTNVDGVTSKLNERMPEVSRILVNVDEITGELRVASKDVGQLIKHLDALAQNADTTVTVARQTMTTADELMKNDVKAILKRFDSVAANADITVTAARDTMTRARETMTTAEDLMKNDVRALIKNLDSTVDSVDTTLTVARGTMTTADELMKNDIRGLIKNVDSVVLNADETVVAARDTMTTVEGLVQNDVKLLIKDFRSAANAFEKLNSDIDDLLLDNREPLDVFASQGLVEFTKLIEEARLLVASSTRLVDELQTDPAQFLFGRQKGGRQAQ
ncbi:MAG: MlaD family protein [Alphaproteobacteria bacterium]|jgi:phospholipid/cholesterol/gamma-HCH transport system substrate-binding protein|nr:MlaD family protein [Alphaproteobacteria bacterium]